MTRIRRVYRFVYLSRSCNSGSSAFPIYAKDWRKIVLSPGSLSFTFETISFTNSILISFSISDKGACCVEWVPNPQFKTQHPVVLSNLSKTARPRIGEVVPLLLLLLVLIVYHRRWRKVEQFTDLMIIYLTKSSSKNVFEICLFLYAARFGKLRGNFRNLTSWRNVSEIGFQDFILPYTMVCTSILYPFSQKI